MRKLADLISELKRRRVFRVAVVYAGIAFIIFQIVDATFDYLPIPAWVGTALIVVLLLCFPVAVGLAWAFDLTAEGLVRTRESKRDQPKKPPRPVIGNKSLVVVAAVAVALAVWSWWGRPSPEAEAVAEAGLGERSIAVLPFVNFSDSKDDEYFSDGITDDILTHLSKIGDMEVIARTSSMLYKNSDKRARDIGRELGVATLLEGSVRRYGNRVRITSQLIDVATEKHLWADEYDRDLTDIFAIQSDVAQQIAAALKATLTPEEEQRIEDRPTANLEAYDFFLRGLDYFWEQGKRRIGIQMYETAVALDPTFALAYAQLASSHMFVYVAYEDHTPERLAKAKAAVDQALELDPDLPTAHFALGKYYYQGLLDYDRATEQFTILQKSIPNHSQSLAWIGRVQQRQGEFEQALANFRKAYELDPRVAGRARVLANTYHLLRRYPEAEQYYSRAIVLRPDDFRSYSSKAWLYIRWDGNIRKARRVLDEAIPNLDNAADPQLFRERARLNLFDRNYSAALEQLARAPEVQAGGENYTPRSLWYAQVYSLMGRGDPAQAYYDSTRMLLEAKLQEDPEDSRYHSTLGIAYAGLGRKEEALRAGHKGVALYPISLDAGSRGYNRERDLAIIYTMVGEYEAAVDKLAYLLSIPGSLSVPWLRLDPTWDPLREHPRFEALVAG